MRRNPTSLLDDVDLAEDQSLQSEMDINLLEVSLQASEFKLLSWLPDRLMKPGEVAPFVWKSDGKQVDKCARQIGRPYQLTTEIHSFVVQTGLMEAFRDVLYSDDSQRGSHEKVKYSTAWRQRESEL
jgi:hypothetical protein